jgi:hypothetical protein
MVDPDTPNDRRRGTPSGWEAFLIIGSGLALAALGLWWANLPSSRDRSPVAEAIRASAGREPSGPYIGARACRECHPGESALYPGSGHARTLRPAARLPLARRLDGRSVADPEKPGVTWSYALRDGEFRVERKEAGAVERFVIDYAFGSDHHATTFVSLIDPSAPSLLEHRLTHYSAGDTLGLTPGQRAARPSPGTTPVGRKPSPEDTVKCFRCHSTRTSITGDGLELNDLIPNVSCERCHGPARAHVSAARGGRPDLSMPFGFENWTAESQLALCGQCHRHPSRAVPGLVRPENTDLARFQPVGISQSKCYTRSAGAFSCVTCHDPHARASSNRAGYEPACLKCHEPAGGGKAACPVSPRSGCIDCHMPRVDTGQHVLFTDHWIRVRESPATRQGRDVPVEKR